MCAWGLAHESMKLEDPPNPVFVSGTEFTFCLQGGGGGY